MRMRDAMVVGVLLGVPTVLAREVQGSKSDRGRKMAWRDKLENRYRGPVGHFGFSEGLGRVVVDGKRGYIDKKGKMVIPPQFECSWDFYEGLAMVSVNRKRGFINRTGKLVIPAVYDDALHFMEGVAAVKRKEKWGFVDKSGQWVIAPAYDSIWPGFSHGRSAVDIGGKLAYIDKKGKLITEPVYTYAGPFRNGLACVRKGSTYGFINTERWGFIDPNGRTVIPLRYYSGGTFSKKPRYASVKGPRGWFFIDTTGRVVIPPRPNVGAGLFSEGLAGVRLTDPATRVGKLGYIDRHGKWAIRPAYDTGWPFSEGLAGVALKRKWGFIDKKAERIIPFRYDDVEPFSEGFARVKLADKWGYIARTGRFLWKPTK